MPNSRGSSTQLLRLRARRLIVQQRENLAPLARHHDGVLEVRRQAAVPRHRRPPVGQHLHVRLARVDHRLDREHHAFRQPRAPSTWAVVRDLRLLVQRRADSVTHELAHHRKPVRFHVLLYRGADIRDARARLHGLDSVKQRLLGHPQQRRGVIGRPDRPAPSPRNRRRTRPAARPCRSRRHRPRSAPAPTGSRAPPARSPTHTPSPDTRGTP